MVTKGVAALLLVVSLSACGGNGSDGSPKAINSDGTVESTPGKTPSNGPKLPACEDIWKAGATLPTDYAGCILSGETRLEQSTKCKDGTRLIVHDEQFYALTSQKIVEVNVAPLEDSPAYGKVFSACTGK